MPVSKTSVCVVGSSTLGRVWNVMGQPVDGKPIPDDVEYYPIHHPAPAFEERTKIAALYADAEQLGGTEVTVAGWVRSVRDMKNFGFVTLNDGSCFKDLQVVMNRETCTNTA